MFCRIPLAGLCFGGTGGNSGCRLPHALCTTMYPLTAALKRHHTNRHTSALHLQAF